MRRGRVRTFRATPAVEGEEPLVWLRSVRDCVLDGLRPRAGTRRVVRLSGADTAGIRLERSDFRQVERVATVDTDVAASAPRMQGNAAPPSPR